MYIYTCSRLIRDASNGDYVVPRGQDPSEIRWEGVLRRCPSSMELAANRTQVDAFHASFQAHFENVLVPDYSD